MNYTFCDLLDKLINIEESTLEMYDILQANLKGQFNSSDIIVNSIKKEELKHIKYYKDLKKELENNSNEEIDFYLYDKVVKLLFEFKNQKDIPKINNAQQLIKYAYELEKKNISLLIDIQGRLIQKEDDVNKKMHKVIDEIIKEEEEHEKMFEKLII